MSKQKTINTTQRYIDSLGFRMMPQDGGQIVEVTYAVDGYGVWCRDRATGLMTLETAEGDYWLIGGCSDRDVQEILDRFATEDERWEVG